MNEVRAEVPVDQFQAHIEGVVNTARAPGPRQIELLRRLLPPVARAGDDRAAA